MKTANQVNCSSKTARKGQRYYTKKHCEFTGRGETTRFDNSARPQKAKPIELVGLFKAL